MTGTPCLCVRGRGCRSLRVRRSSARTVARTVGAPGAVRVSSSSPRAMPMQLATVATVLSGDSGWTFSRSSPARRVSPARNAGNDLTERVGGDLSGRADRGEQFEVASFDSAVERRLQGVHVGDVVAGQVDAFFGQQRRQLAQHLVGYAGRVLDAWGARPGSGPRRRMSAMRPILASRAAGAGLRRSACGWTVRAAGRAWPSPGSCGAGR